MWILFCIGFIDFLWNSRGLVDYTNLYSLSNYGRNDEIILKYFQKMKKYIYCVICGKKRKFGKPKISYLLDKVLVYSTICSKSKNEDEKVFKEENSIDSIGWIGNI